MVYTAPAKPASTYSQRGVMTARHVGRIYQVNSKLTTLQQFREGGRHTNSRAPPEWQGAPESFTQQYQQGWTRRVPQPNLGPGVDEGRLQKERNQ